MPKADVVHAVQHVPLVVVHHVLVHVMGLQHHLPALIVLLVVLLIVLEDAMGDVIIPVRALLHHQPALVVHLIVLLVVLLVVLEDATKGAIIPVQGLRNHPPAIIVLLPVLEHVRVHVKDVVQVVRAHALMVVMRAVRVVIQNAFIFATRLVIPHVREVVTLHAKVLVIF